MKSMCEIAALIVLLSITAVSNVFADSYVVTVTNNTTYTLTQLYASPSSSATWDTTTNLLTGGLTLPPGAQATITIGTGSGDDSACKYDLMGVLYGATQHAYGYSINTCGGGTWAITSM